MKAARAVERTYNGERIDSLPVHPQRNGFRLLSLLLFFYSAGGESERKCDVSDFSPQTHTHMCEHTGGREVTF